MPTNQPDWQLVANLGDRNPIDHGGYFVFTDRTGVYPPEAELLVPPDENGTRKWEVRRFLLEPCTYINGILSDNKFHPEHPAWFADSLDEVASTMGINVDDLITLFLSNNPIDRAQAWRMIGDYHGFDNLDSYPEYYTRKEVESRY